MIPFTLIDNGININLYQSIKQASDQNNERASSCQSKNKNIWKNSNQNRWNMKLNCKSYRENVERGFEDNFSFDMNN